MHGHGTARGHAPERVKASSLDDYLEVMTRAVFQVGLNWRTVDAKWPGFREAFLGFDPVKVAGFTPGDVERLAQDARIIRNHKKIEATIANAAEMIEIEREHGSFRRYLHSFSDFDGLVKDLERRFRFLGDTGAYYFLYVVGEKVPSWEDWAAEHGMRLH